jgi:hypothetical protein
MCPHTTVHVSAYYYVSREKIDHSFGPRSLTGPRIYLGKDTIHGKVKHIIVTSTLLAMTEETLEYAELNSLTFVASARVTTKSMPIETQNKQIFKTHEG